MNITLNWAIFLCFVWLVVRSIQQQSLSAQPTRDLINEDLQKVGRIAGRCFDVARGIADMTAALLLLLWKALTAKNTQKYLSRVAIFAFAFDGKLKAAARPAEVVSVEDDPELKMFRMRLEGVDPSASCVAAKSTEEAALPDPIDPDEEAVSIVAGLRAGMVAHNAFLGGATAEKSVLPLQTDSVCDAPVWNAESKLGHTEVAEGALAELVQSITPGFGTAKVAAQKPSKKNAQPRKGDASKSGGLSVPESVRKLPRNDSGARRLQPRGQQRGGR